MNRAIILGLFCLSACGSQVSGPAEVSFAGLTYNVRPPAQFVGLPKTSALPPVGTAEYNGVWRAQSGNENYRNGTSKVVVDFGSQTAIVSGRVDFQGDQGLGIVNASMPASISGTQFIKSPTVVIPPPSSGPGEPPSVPTFRPDGVVGQFYGRDASVAAGLITVSTGINDTLVRGAFIAQR